MTSPEPAVPPLEFDDPADRFDLLGFVHVRRLVGAIIVDRKTGKRHSVKLRDEIAEYEVLMIDVKKETVELRGPDKKVVLLSKSARPPSR